MFQMVKCINVSGDFNSGSKQTECFSALGVPIRKFSLLALGLWITFFLSTGALWRNSSEEG